MSIRDFYDATSRDIYNQVRAWREQQEFDIEQEWEYQRHGMWASIAPHSTKTIKVHQIIQLKRDKIAPALSEFEKQELAKWSAKMDAEMNIENG